MAAPVSGLDADTSAPVIILVRPQLAQNIGKVARAMANFGLSELRLVAPRDGWPNPPAYPAASGADWILNDAKVYPTTAEAVADLNAVYATTARPREMIKTVETPRHAGQSMRDHGLAGRRVGVLFGAEAAGLTNDELVKAETIITVPCSPDFTSLNIAQAVLLVAYEWFQAADHTPGKQLASGDARLATQDEVEGFLLHLEEELTLSGFLRPPEKAPHMKRNIRSIFQRLELLDQDVRTLRGIIKSLVLFGRSAGKMKH